MADRDQPGEQPVIIKKYANRRLYNTQSSSYITLDDLGRMVRDDVEFQVLDAKTGKDITHAILTQIIMEEESQGEQMLPVSFLRQLIGMYGNSMQAMMPPYLEAAMNNFRTNQAKLHEAFTANVGPNAFAKMAERNMAMFQAAANAFMPGSSPAPGGSANGRTQQPADDAGRDSDIDALKAQMAEMQRKLDKLQD
ncbi:polyhydroxyalkanoate synthesis repressor PhaR [Aurantiacibacter spongiae]|uniref:Polyhydroxyalkanoate synthesis repressor PhaR n=1 Tax=Aurantiacibacter spongiae TaxID=2488860 RepID=A0A3N5CNX0_9SPHN|nr:polyhydroxyalkanoate synthesis repressor PhaR [Aurantiacibacter spongiae]RPF70277.1 polyhydroxyalkanoate synthesis repressor PhaR [Aurantiacibacter spongiae]